MLVVFMELELSKIHVYFDPVPPTAETEGATPHTPLRKLGANDPDPRRHATEKEVEEGVLGAAGEFYTPTKKLHDSSELDASPEFRRPTKKSP